MPTNLPQQYQASHEFALNLHDRLADIVVAGEERELVLRDLSQPQVRVQAGNAKLEMKKVA